MMRLAHRLELGNARARLQPGATAAPGADAHLDRVRPEVGQTARRLGRGDVADHERHLSHALPERAHRLDDGRGVGVGDVEQQHVDLLADERLGPLEEIARRPHRRPHPQPAPRVLGGVRLLLVELEVAHGDEAAHLSLLVQER
jgi:hypothetical protein